MCFHGQRLKKLVWIKEENKWKILYEHQTAALKQIFEAYLLTVREKRKNAHIHDWTLHLLI